ncbi:MAG TPA: hypothetical protein VGK67_00010 [Myxococcales bacterium]|jgi:hypothetical protein
MSNPNEQELQQRFQALKDRDQRQAPAFRSMWRMPESARSSRPWLVVAAASCSIVLVFATLAQRQAGLAPRPRQIVQRAPLDFLLDQSHPTSSLPLPAAVGRGFLE